MTAQKPHALFELSEQYRHAAELQKEAIDNVKKKYKQLPNRVSSREGMRLSSLLQSLYAQRRELLATSAHLRHYYRFSSAGGQA